MGGGRVFRREQAAPPTGLPVWPCFSSCSQCVPDQEYMPPAKPRLWLQSLCLAERACWSAGRKGPFWEEKGPPWLLRSPWVTDHRGQANRLLTASISETSPPSLLLLQSTKSSLVCGNPIRLAPLEAPPWGEQREA